MSNVNFNRPSNERNLKNLIVFPNDVHRIVNFQIDYSSFNSNQRKFFSMENQASKIDILMSRLIEDWYSNEVLKNDLSSFTSQTQHFNWTAINYFDLAFQVMGIQIMKKSVCLTVFDGTEAGIKVSFK